MTQKIRLTESQLRDIINESVMQVMNEHQRQLQEGAMMDKMKMMWNVIKKHPQESFAALVSAGLLAGTLAMSDGYTGVDNYEDGSGAAIVDPDDPTGDYGHYQTFDDMQRELNDY